MTDERWIAKLQLIATPIEPDPAFVERLRERLATELGFAEPQHVRRGFRGVPRAAQVAAAAVVILVVAVVASAVMGPPRPGIGGPPSSPSLSPAPSSPTPSGLPTTVDGLRILSVGEALEARAAGGLKDQPVALRGYWSGLASAHSCPYALDQPGELELYCHDGEDGITERDEPILRAAGPHLTPFVPETFARRLFARPIANGQQLPPVPIVVVGHFDDPRAADCRPQARQLCRDRFVIDRIVSFGPRPTESGSVYDRLLSLITGEWCMREYDRDWPSPAELDALIQGAGGLERWIKADDLWAGSLEALAASVDGEVVGELGASTFVVLDPGDGFPYALGMHGVSSAAGHPVWVVMARLHDCDDPKRRP